MRKYCQQYGDNGRVDYYQYYPYLVLSSKVIEMGRDTPCYLDDVEAKITQVPEHHIATSREK
jgi:hypothetical protein